VAQLRGEFARARHFLEEALVARNALIGDSPLDVFGPPVQSCLAQVALEEGDLTEAQQRAEEALELAEAIGFPSFVCQASIALGEVRYMQGRMELARSIWEAGLARVRETRQRFDHVVQLLIDLGRLAQERGDGSSARSFLSEALLYAEDLSRWQLAHALEAAAELADNRASSFLQLAATATMLRDTLGTPLWPTEQVRLESALARARENLDSEEAELAWRRGRSAPVHQTVAMAVQLLEEPPSGGRVAEPQAMHMPPALRRAQDLTDDARLLPVKQSALPPAADTLTAREREIASLIADGLSNRDLAERLVISEGTVEVHVKHILSKLNFRSRTQVATWFADRRSAGEGR
jgi:non-specific serine/threonine protein kinase